MIVLDHRNKFAESAAAFAHLDHLELDDNALTDTPERFEGLAKVVHVGDNHDESRIEEADYDDRFTTVGEEFFGRFVADRVGSVCKSSIAA